MCEHNVEIYSSYACSCRPDMMYGILIHCIELNSVSLENRTVKHTILLNNVDAYVTKSFCIDHGKSQAHIYISCKILKSV